ncbi:MAG: hypothetical protein WBG71_02495 [Leeuwenhoekiella sp.]
MKKVFETPFGKATCHDTYVYFENNGLEKRDIKDIRELLNNISQHYGASKYVWISYRKTAIELDPKAYDFVDHKQMVGIAIVSDHIESPEILIPEQELYDGSFAYFPTLEQAISWAKTVV